MGVVIEKQTKYSMDDDQIFDIKVDPDTKITDYKSGGLSLFNRPKLENGNDWWVIPAGTDLPHKFTVSKDLTDGVFKGHYTIRSLGGIHIDDWKRILKNWAE